MFLLCRNLTIDSSSLLIIQICLYESKAVRQHLEFDCYESRLEPLASRTFMFFGSNNTENFSALLIGDNQDSTWLYAGISEYPTVLVSFSSERLAVKIRSVQTISRKPDSSSELTGILRD
jgi:hypothetical protein